ncbi:MAG: hypothetical protein EBV38_02525 [Burkholderiaceae bacterium]|nr:hypothetical protein [Burkholderiaceae bacterium]
MPASNQPRRVVVTGLGLISPVGNSVASAWANLIAGKTGIATVTKFDHSALSVHFAGEVKDFNVEEYISAKEARHMDTFIHYGIAAGTQAIKDSGLEVTDQNSERIGVLVGSGIGGLPMIEDTNSELLSRGPRRISPFFVPGSIINMISGHLSILFNLKGPNVAAVHDDLPCMDDDDLRRGRPTVHKAFDEATALLVGDALQTRAFEILSNVIDADSLIRLAQLEMIQSLAHASGSKGMAGGQAIDLQNVGKKMDLPALEEMHAMKTGALLLCAVQLGGIAAQLPPASMTSLDTYARALGLAFQVVDDILDATADSATLGKTAGKDAAQDKPTYVTLKGLDYANELAKELKGRALDSLNEFGPQADALRHLAHLVVDRKK